MASEELRPTSKSESKKNPMSRAMREVAWLLGCVAAAAAFCFIAPEYGYAPVLFFTVCLYLLTGIVRLFLHYFVRWLSPPN